MKPSFPPEPRGKVSVIIALAIGLVLSSCATVSPTLISHKNVVYVPPSSLFNCPLAALPSTFTSNQQVAQTLNNTYGNNVVCHNNMNALRNDLNNQKKIFSK